VLPGAREARAISLTTSEPFHRDGCVYEEKIDGWRIIAYKASASA
jgi:hypothetical protein